jgi:hypothetical protein
MLYFFFATIAIITYNFLGHFSDGFFDLLVPSAFHDEFKDLEEFAKVMGGTGRSLIGIRSPLD